MRRQKKLPKSSIDESVPMGDKVKESDAGIGMAFENISILATLPSMFVDSCAAMQVDVNAISVSPTSTCSSLKEYITLGSRLVWGVNQLHPV